MYDFARSLLMAGLFGFIALCVLLFFYQRSLLYYHTTERALMPGDFTLQQGDVSLVIRARQTHLDKAVIYFGGNAEDVSISIGEFERTLPSMALYAMHYRGYGGSEGRPTEEGLVADALALYDAIAASHPSIILVGRSLGSGVAIQLANARPVDQLVLITPFDSLLKVAQKQFPFVPVQWLMLDRYESWRYASELNVPTVLVAAEDDEIIPLERAEQLLEAFQPGIATLHVLPGLNHNSYIDLSEFLTQPQDEL